MIGNCACESCRTNFEESNFCKRVGRFGCKRFQEDSNDDDNSGSGRCCLMGFATILSCIGVLFAILSCLALSEDIDTLKNFSWSYGESTADSGEIFLGLYGIVECPANQGCKYTEYGNDECTAQFCDDCKNASSDSIPTAVMGVVTYLPQVLTDIQRSTPEGDINCQKFLGILTGIIGFVTTISAISTYTDACQNGLEDHTTGIQWVLGPGLAFLFLSAAIKPFDVIFHCILPTPLEKTADDYDLEKLVELQNNGIKTATV